MATARHSRVLRTIPSLILLILFGPFAHSKVIYVDDDAAGANDGSSWDNAYTCLQDALAYADSAEKPVEMRVAQGIYRPAQGAGVAPPEGADRRATFQLINNVTLAGGYAGLGQPDPNARDIEFYETILSGDLDSDDVEDEPQTNNENSYNVVTCRGTEETAVLDGFTIIAGNANDVGNNRGGGMYNHNSSPTLTKAL